MLRNVLHLLRPPFIVAQERLAPAMGGNLVEARLGDGEQRPGRNRLQPEFDESRRLGRVIDIRVDGVGMPGEREKPFGIDVLDRRLPDDVFVPRVQDMSARDLAGNERSVELDAEPLAELAMSVIARQTRDTGAFSSMRFSMSVDMGNLLVASYWSSCWHATF